MCRKTRVWGSALVAFGAGLLVGSWVDGGFLFFCLAVGLICVGIGLMK